MGSLTDRVVLLCKTLNELNFLHVNVFGETSALSIQAQKHISEKGKSTELFDQLAMISRLSFGGSARLQVYVLDPTRNVERRFRKNLSFPLERAHEESAISAMCGLNWNIQQIHLNLKPYSVETVDDLTLVATLLNSLQKERSTNHQPYPADSESAKRKRTLLYAGCVAHSDCNTWTFEYEPHHLISALHQLPPQGLPDGSGIRLEISFEDQNCYPSGFEDPEGATRCLHQFARCAQIFFGRPFVSFQQSIDASFCRRLEFGSLESRRVSPAGHSFTIFLLVHDFSALTLYERLRNWCSQFCRAKPEVLFPRLSEENERWLGSTAASIARIIDRSLNVDFVSDCHQLVGVTESMMAETRILYLLFASLTNKK